MSFDSQKKEIIYRGGIVRFFIPINWTEEYVQDGGGIFYEPGESTGTLRVSVLSFLTDEDVPLTYPLRIIESRCPKYNGQIEKLPNSRFLLKYSIKVDENAEELIVFYWEVARMVSPRDYNIAVFSFTIGSREVESTSYLQVVASIEEEIKGVNFWIHSDLYEK